VVGACEFINELLDSIKCGNFLTNWRAVSFSGRTLLQVFVYLYLYIYLFIYLKQDAEENIFDPRWRGNNRMEQDRQYTYDAFLVARFRRRNISHFLLPFISVAFIWSDGLSDTLARSLCRVTKSISCSVLREYLTAVTCVSLCFKLEYGCLSGLTFWNFQVLDWTNAWIVGRILPTLFFFIVILLVAMVTFPQL